MRWPDFQGESLWVIHKNGEVKQKKKENRTGTKKVARDLGVGARKKSGLAKIGKKRVPRGKLVSR